MSIVTVRPNASSWNGTPQLIGGSATFHQATSDNNSSTYFVVRGTASGFGPGQNVLLGFPAPSIPSGYAISMVKLRTAFARVGTQEDQNYLYTDIRLSQVSGPFIASGYTKALDSGAQSEVPTAGAINNANLNNIMWGSVWAVFEATDADIAVYEAYLDFYVEPLPVPINVYPGDGFTVTTSTPAVDGYVGAPGAFPNMTYKREWQISTSTTFSSDVRTVTDTTWAAVWANAIPWQGARLPQSTYYIRARTLSWTGEYSSWSAYNTFVVSHPPSPGSLSPAGGESAVYDTTPTVSWRFTDPDPNDFQTAYQVQMWRVVAPSDVLDSGGVASGTANHTFTLPDPAINWKETDLRWRVKVRDRDSVWGPWSNDHGFIMRDLPTVTIAVPTNGGTVTVSAPNFQWASNRPMGQFKVDVYNITPNPDVLLVSSGWQNANQLMATSWTPPIPIMSVGPTFRVVVSIVDIYRLINSTSVDFTASYVPPPAPSLTVSSTTYATTALRSLDWSGISASGSFYSWRIYRRVADVGAWKLVKEIFDVGTRVWHDYTSPSQVPIQYAIVQVATSIGVPIESNYVPSGTFLGTLENYMLVCPDDEGKNMTLWHVTADNFSDEQEMATQNIAGRGRVTEYGSRFGQSGSLTASFRDVPGETARQQRLKLEALRSSGLAVYLLNPFGDSWPVSLSQASVSRIAGTGLQESATVDIEYMENSA